MSQAKNKRPKHLWQLGPEEVSLVDEGANGKRILITKRHTPMATKQQRTRAAASLTVEQRVIKRVEKMDPKERKRIEKSVDTLAATRAKIRKDLMGDEDTAAGAPPPMSEAAQAALKAAARIMQPYADEITQSDLDYVGETLNMQGVADEADPDAAEALADDDDIEMAADEDLEDDAKDADGDEDVEMAADDDGDHEDDDDAEDVEKSDDDADEGTSESDDVEKADDDEDLEGAGEDDDPGPSDDDDAASDTVQIAVPDEPPPGVEDADHEAAAAAARAAYASTLESSGYKVAKRKTVQKRAPRETMATGKSNAVATRIEKRFATMEKSLAELTKINKSLAGDLKTAQKNLAVERDARVSREYAARVERDFGNLGNKDKIAKSLRTVAETQGEEAAKELEAIFKSANERVTKAAEYGGDLFSEIGSSQGDDGAASGEAAINQMTNEIIEKAAGTGKELSRAQAARQVLKSKEGRAQYKNYRNEARR